jgi:hypothetical protein
MFMVYVCAPTGWLVNVPEARNVDSHPVFEPEREKKNTRRQAQVNRVSIAGRRAVSGSIPERLLASKFAICLSLF